MKVIKLTSIAVLTFTLTACTEWAIDSAETGWSFFEAGDLDSARYYFEDATTWDPTYADAYNGLGWCDLLDDDLSQSVADFENALTYDITLADASAGASLAYTERGEHYNAVVQADRVISADPSYVFSHYSTVDINDIRLAKAKSSAAQGDFSTALAEVQEIDPSFTANPQTGEGQADILEKIEALIAQHGG